MTKFVRTIFYYSNSQVNLNTDTDKLQELIDEQIKKYNNCELIDIKQSITSSRDKGTVASDFLILITLIFQKNVVY